MKLFALRTLYSAMIGFVVSAVFMIVEVFKEAFPLEAVRPENRTDTADTEHVDRMSQTGKGVAAFITDLFKVEGRTYTWQAGTIA